VTDDSERPVAVVGPPTVDEVLTASAASTLRRANTSASVASDDAAAAMEAGGDVVGHEADGAVDIEGPNSA